MVCSTVSGTRFSQLKSNDKIKVNTNLNELKDNSVTSPGGRLTLPKQIKHKTGD